MTDWVNANVGFQDRSRILTIPRTDRGVSAKIFHALREQQHTTPWIPPNALEEIVLSAIHEARPELIGCTLWYMSIDPVTQSWQFGVSHGSFERIEPGMHCKKEPLFNRETE